MALYFANSDDEFNFLDKELVDENAGAFVRFSGRVRRFNRDQEVAFLFYEGATRLAQNMFFSLEALVRERFLILQSHGVHRLGQVEVGCDAVSISVLASHRKEAFLGAEFLMNELKQSLPIWKKEVYIDGTFLWGASHDICRAP